MARIDGLTGIYNRRHLFELAKREFDVAMRYQVPLSMMLFDIDDFKQVNDSFGHLMGDQVLQQITRVVRSVIRSVDVFGRYGGDEFVVLLPQATAKEVLPLAERIHTSIAAMRIETDKDPFTVTLSIGVAQTTHDTGQSDTTEELFSRADQALYAAKETGKDRTVIFGQST